MQQFRHAVQLILGNLTPDVDVKCVDPTLGGHYTPFPQVIFYLPAEPLLLILACCCCLSRFAEASDIVLASHPYHRRAGCLWRSPHFWSSGMLMSAHSAWLEDHP